MTSKTAQVSLRKALRVLSAAVWLLAVGCNGTTGRMDLRLRAICDSHNKASFVNRYQDPEHAIEQAYTALQLVHDSLPTYTDGQLRAYNNLAFGFYMLAQHDSAAAYIDSVKALVVGSHVRSRNAEVEHVLAQLMHIRLLQRDCRIAESYQLLYDMGRSHVLQHQPDNYLYSLAQMEYYITSLTLNYHYRNRAVASSSGTALTHGTQQTMQQLLSEVEQARPRLRCDYAEDLSLNYALAHSYYRLAAATGSDAHLLGRAYDYLADNASIMLRPGQQSIYHLANVFQLQAFIVADTNIDPDTYNQQCLPQRDRLAGLTSRLYTPDSLQATGQYGFDMFRVSTDLFFQTTDPYQHLGAVVAAAEYCLHEGDTAEARRYYAMALDDTSWHDGMAPKFEAMFYDGLIRMGYSSRAADNTRWYARQVELLNLISQNESADLMLQDRLYQSESRNRYYTTAIAVSMLFLVVLTVLVLLLRRRSRVLRAEKQALQQAKRQDVERIANVETCLSVLRHDISPFLSYLSNPQLDSTLRQEVLQQLLRTFANIKSWTNLSVPGGLRFRPSNVSLAEVMQSVDATSMNPHPDSVDLRMVSTTLCVQGDRQLLEILLRNLVNNALQHTEQGSVEVSAEVYAEDSRFVHLRVSDTGCGMDEETVEQLFRADKQPVRSADPSAAYGTGFGLILCKYIIKQHDDNTQRGCRIWAESQLGHGTTLHCLLAQSKVEN